ncbi:MAG: HNH endonuclease [Paludibacteraceae bacterium]|nr:HNH endonuclease [Paludibacteraceae bacterium]
MRQRSFELIRQPELEGSSFLFDNVLVSYVGTCPETGISFYCSTRTTYGVRVYPDGRKVHERATHVKGFSYSHGKAVYLQFKQAFGHRKGIYVSHAVWMAAGRTVKPGFTMDHINGNTLDNSLPNLRCIDNNTNNRDGGFLRKLRNKGFNPVTIDRSYLLRYYTRMAVIKATVSRYRYRRLSCSELHRIIFYPNWDLVEYFNMLYNIQIDL